MQELFGRRYDTAQPVRVEIVGGKVSRVTPVAADEPSASKWPWISPGFFDIQINGYGGQEFASADLTPEKVGEIVRAFDASGVVRCCPTVTTQRFEVLEHALRTIAAACESSADVARRVAGVHVEGPYITPEDGARGAHPLEYVRRPNWDEFQRLQEAAGGRIRILTMSVEFQESFPFIERVAGSGVVVSIGHTSAGPTRIRRAVDAGVRLSTHLGNGSHPQIHRFRNYLWPQLAEDRLMAGLIVDGHHLPPDVVKTFVRAKRPKRCILVSDISGQAGRPPGRYTSDFCDVELLADGRLVVAGQRELLAGAALPLCAGIPNVMQFAGVDLQTAVQMAVHHPADLLGLEPGGLEPGNPADLVQFDLVTSLNGSRRTRLEVRTTLVQGECVWGTAWRP